MYSEIDFEIPCVALAVNQLHLEGMQHDETTTNQERKYLRDFYNVTGANSQREGIEQSLKKHFDKVVCQAKKIYEDPSAKHDPREYRHESFSLAVLMATKIKLRDTVQKIQSHSDVDSETANEMLLGLGSRYGRSN